MRQEPRITDRGELLRALGATDRLLSRLVRRIEETVEPLGRKSLALELERSRRQVQRNRGLLRQAPQDAELWTNDQHVHAADLSNAQRVALTEPEPVPILQRIRDENRLWLPGDYAELPAINRQGPGYTLLENVFLTGPGMALAPDGRYVEDGHTRLIPGELSPAFERDLALGPGTRSRWPVAADDVKRGILISGPGLRSYGHQLLDFLPGLAMLDEHGVFPDWPLLLSVDSPAWTLPMLEAFGGQRREIRWFGVGRRTRTRARELCVPWMPRQFFVPPNSEAGSAVWGAFHPSVKPVFDRIAKAALDRHGSLDRKRRICMLRQATAANDRRQLTNADEVRAVFEARGFECIVPEHLSFLDQVRLFAGAEVTAGEAGSGLHGAVFSEPGTTTLEMRPETYQLLAQPAIAVLKGHAFASVEGTQPGGTWVGRQPWTLDPELVGQWLSEVGL